MITLTLTFDNAEQAQQVLEAYAEIKECAGDRQQLVNEYPITPPAYVPVPHPNPAPGYEPSLSVTGRPIDNMPPTAELDTRGVPWHSDHHSSSKKQSKGAWDRKRGHDRKAADAYEAQFVGNGKPATVAASTTAHIAPSVAAPQPMGVVSIIDFQNLWVHLCQTAQVTGLDEKHVIDTWGGHPMTEVFHDDRKRQLAYAFLCSKRAY